MKPFAQLRLHPFDGCQSESAEESGARFKLGATENKFGRYRQAELRRNESNRQRRRSPDISAIAHPASRAACGVFIERLLPPIGMTVEQLEANCGPP
jgi:hypothetical protein